MIKMSYDSLALFYLMGSISKDTIRLGTLIKWITKEEYKKIVGEDWQMPSMEIIKLHGLEFVLKDPKYMGDDVQS